MEFETLVDKEKSSTNNRLKAHGLEEGALMKAIKKIEVDEEDKMRNKEGMELYVLNEGGVRGSGGVHDKGIGGYTLSTTPSCKL